MRALLYTSSNGDRWFLCRGEDDADVFVVHEPNGPSGGAHSRIEVAEFLGSRPGSPECRALLTRIGALVEAVPGGSTLIPRGPEPGAAGAEPTPGEAVALV